MCELAVHLPDLMWTFMSAEDSEITSDEEHVSSKGMSMLMQASGAKPGYNNKARQRTEPIATNQTYYALHQFVFQESTYIVLICNIKTASNIFFKLVMPSNANI